MNPELSRRIVRVAKLLKVLEKLALSEKDFIERGSTRSLEIMRRSLAKIEKAAVKLSPEKAHLLMEAIHKVVTPAGVVDQASTNSGSKPGFQLILFAKEHIPQLQPAVARLLSGALYAGRMQNNDLVEMAKVDQKYTRMFMSFQEGFSSSLSKMSQLLDKIDYSVGTEDLVSLRKERLKRKQERRKNRAKNKEKKAPAKEERRNTGEDPQDSSALEAVEAQVKGIEREMRSEVMSMSRAITERARDLYPNDPDLFDALDSNIEKAIHASGKVYPKIFKDKDYYSDILELQAGDHYDLGEFLGTKRSKAIYHAYRSLIMAIRSLGVAQWAQKRPDLVLANPKAQKLLINAQQILSKRSKLVHNKLDSLPNQSEESNSEESFSGFPEGN